MWVLAPSMGGCVSVRADAAAHDVSVSTASRARPTRRPGCSSELGRVDGSPPIAPMPWAAWLFVAVPAAAILLGFRAARASAPSIARARRPRACCGGRRVRRARERRSRSRRIAVAVGRATATRRAPSRSGPTRSTTVAARAGLGGRGRRRGERGDAGAAAAQPPSLTSAEVRLDLGVTAPRGRPPGVVAGILLDRRRRAPGDPRCRRTCARTRAGIACPSACTAPPPRRRDPSGDSPCRGVDRGRERAPAWSTAVLFGSRATNRSHAWRHPSSVRGKRSEGCAGDCRSQMPKSSAV